MAEKEPRQIGFGQVLKQSMEENGAEVKAMLFVRNNTSIPVPRLKDAWIDDRDDFAGPFVSCCMKFMHGDTLERMWRILTADQKSGLARELREIVEELRALGTMHSSGYQLCNIAGDALRDNLLSHDESGPFSTHDDLLSYLVQDLGGDSTGNLIQDAKRVLKEPVNDRICFTHCDLVPRNILIDQHSCKVVGILDWAQAGWMPAYWEFTKAKAPWEKMEQYHGWDAFSRTAFGPFQVASDLVAQIWGKTRFR